MLNNFLLETVEQIYLGVGSGNNTSVFEDLSSYVIALKTNDVDEVLIDNFVNKYTPPILNDNFDDIIIPTFSYEFKVPVSSLRRNPDEQVSEEDKILYKRFYDKFEEVYFPEYEVLRKTSDIIDKALEGDNSLGGELLLKEHIPSFVGMSFLNKYMKYLDFDSIMERNYESKNSLHDTEWNLLKSLGLAMLHDYLQLINYDGIIDEYNKKIEKYMSDEVEEITRKIALAGKNNFDIKRAIDGEEDIEEEMSDDSVNPSGEDLPERTGVPYIVSHLPNTPLPVVRLHQRTDMLPSSSEVIDTFLEQTRTPVSGIESHLNSIRTEIGLEDIGLSFAERVEANFSLSEEVSGAIEELSDISSVKKTTSKGVIEHGEYWY